MRRAKSGLSKTVRVGITRYLQLYTVLAQKLADGVFRPKQPLPSEPALVKHYGMSRTTVRRALARLEREGRIVRKRGSGTFVRQHQDGVPLACSLQQLCDVKAGRSARTLQSGVSAVPTPLRTRYAELGQRARKVTRLRLNRGRPFQLETIYFASRAGRRSSRSSISEQSITAAAADGFAARHLKVSPGTPLLRLRVALKGVDQRLVALAESVFRPDRCILQAKLRRAGRASRWELESE